LSGTIEQPHALVNLKVGKKTVAAPFVSLAARFPFIREELKGPSRMGRMHHMYGLSRNPDLRVVKVSTNLPYHHLPPFSRDACQLMFGVLRSERFGVFLVTHGGCSKRLEHFRPHLQFTSLTAPKPTTQAAFPILQYNSLMSGGAVVSKSSLCSMLT
jgi:hypothetical protein